MAYYAAGPSDLVPGTVRVISARMDYWPETPHDPWDVLGEGTLGYVSRYALGRDYHKIMRKALARLAESLAGRSGHLAIAFVSTVRRCWKKPWRAMPAWAGSANIPT
jgi:epoxyqueuosine reductase QueG